MLERACSIHQLRVTDEEAMDELTEGSVAASWPDVGKLQCNRNQLPMSTTAMHMLSHRGLFEHQNALFKSSIPCLSGCSVEKQGLNAEELASSNLPGANYSSVQHRQSENTPPVTHLKHDQQIENVDSSMSESQSHGFIQPLQQDFSEVPRNMLQKLLQGSLKLPKLERSPSFGSSGSEKPPCQDISCRYQSAVPLPNGGRFFSSSFSSEVFNGNPTFLSEGGQYFAKGPWIDEALNGSFVERNFHLSDQAHERHIRSSSQQSPIEPHGSAALGPGPARPRTRARRGQATDPHSIAERKRRERITNAMKELQELVPTLNKADRIAFVEDVIEYVKFLQFQTKVFLMSRVSNPGAPLVKETAEQGQDKPEAVTLDLQDYNVATVEEEITRLLEDDMGEALRSLQSKGLCMMPISLAAKNMDCRADQQEFNDYSRCTTSTKANAQTSLNNLQKNPSISRKDRDCLEEADHYDKENSSEVSLRSKDDRDDNEVCMISNDFLLCSQQAPLTQSKDVSSFTNCDSHPSLNTVLPIHALEDVNLLATNGSIVMDKRQADEAGNGNNGFDVIPISLKFVDVTYSVSINKRQLSLKARSLCLRGRPVTQEKQILHGVTGYVLSGELLALMGPSGSGKTTLINLLSGRKNASKGSITYNDVPYSSALKRRMGFVMQDDILHSHLTVLETLQYAALLRLPGSLSKADKLCRAMEVISLLGLESCKDTIIGEPFLHGISGGERKRVSVGCEILINPSLLFLDEPTSGLDSTIALRIVQILQGFSKVGRSVVTTIHQPSSRLFHMFDNLILLSEGHIVYFGEAQAAMEYFSSIQLRPLIAMNPADFLLDVANGNLADMSLPAELEHRVSYARDDTFNLSSQFQLEAQEVQYYITHTYEKTLQPIERDRLLRLCIPSKYKNGISRKRKWGSSWWLQFQYLCMRSFKAQRHEILSWLRIVQVIASALIVGSLWLHSSASTYEQLADQIGLLFFMSSFWTFFPLFQAIVTFPSEKAILAKERASDMYRLSAYLIARTVSDVVLDLCLPILFLFIVYFMASLQKSVPTFLLTLFTIFLTTITAQALGTAIGAAMMDVKKAIAFGAVMLLAFMLAGGFFVQHLPRFIAWVRYVSINFYSFILLVKVQYGREQKYNCQKFRGCESIAASPALHNVPLGGGAPEALILIAMAVSYHFLAYIFLSRMKLSSV
ncbi:hypothetical protein L7F22_021444 [Adiantum nelumboides]|nr:hypothetical protein [Adiantum nelumboides]